MKKLFFLASALAVLAACSNNDDVPVPGPEQEPVSIDLRSMNYEGVMTLLSEQTSLKDVTFNDGELSRTVGELVASDNIDPDQLELLVFNAANPTDSLDMSVTPDYVSVCLNREGQRIAYLTYADTNRQNEIVNLYEEVVPTTRGGESVVTRSTDGNSFKMNLTAMELAIQKKYEAEGTYELPGKELKYQESSAATRGWFSNLFKKAVAVFKPVPATSNSVVHTPTIDLYLLRERGSNNLTHEMNWQADDVIKSLKDIQGNVKFNVHIENCDFKGSNNSHNDLTNFRTWVQNSKYKNTNGVFMLCRWGGWNDVVGRGYIGDYNVNNDLKSYLVTSTTCLNARTMAHEVGHNLGANHVSVKWYQYINCDIMVSGAGFLKGCYHKDSANRAEIKKRLTLK